MRVGILLENFDLTAGGGHTFQSEIFNALLAIGAKARHSFVFLCDPDTAARLPPKPLPNAEVMALDAGPAAPRRTLLGRSKPAGQSLDERLRAAGVEFVWQLGAPGQVLEVPYMVVVWDLQHRLQPWFPEVSANGNWQHRDTLYTAVLGRAAAVIVGTEAGKREVERFFRVDPSRILITPHPTPRFADADLQAKRQIREKYGIAGDYLFYPAQFWAHKNHVNLLLALELLQKRLERPLSAAFVGADHGNLAHVKATSERLGLTGRVHFLGFVPREDLIDLYRQAFALSYVTFFGPENLPPLEAFALGCPVIASEVSGAREQLGDAVLFVDPTSPEGIAEAVMRLESEKNLRANLIDAGKKIAAARTPQGFVADALALLDRFEAVRRCWT
ncbi:glycosyltransferase family 1 protein [Bradyrhizobium sp.]|uniref:glycosyltransferase family 4 protein n=1 Tax=Bradyrhizobium sp. TaxID=376 RepID=UPI0026194FA2|nr:glycosyltransferase family 1 protein [Bradyrhizobium sp.]